MATFKVYLVDTFTRPHQGFSGAPAAVCLLPADIRWSREKLGQIASELGQPETAFIQPLFKREQAVVLDGQREYREASRFTLRWLTPHVEVKFGGHAALAAGHVLFHELDNSTDFLQFDTLGGPLCITREQYQGMERVALLIPADPPYLVDHYHQNSTKDVQLASLPVERRQLLQELTMLITSALGPMAPPLHTVVFGRKSHCLLIHVDAAASQLYDLQPVFTPDVLALGYECKLSCLVLAVTTPHSSSDKRPSRPDVVMRCFAPWLGVSEAPSVGAAYALAGSYWTQQLGRPEFRVLQGHVRQAELSLLVDPNHKDQVQLAGCAVTTLRGTYEL
ncbi:hypothetical protein IWQ62_003455 [Dispira parvispora]|uniref:PhzF family phenazine biosynthesis protein n=1 Tax=Dispira parvispora TaxID=1520584 RepID=A0A9W8AUT0_9FUNG|nr:hypothetical protein IWQ62_003455 [Dispira parvispora]